MPRIQVVVQVIDDEGSRVARSQFFVENDATTVLLEDVSPEELTRDFGEIFTAGLQEQYRILDLEALQVTSTPELPQSLREVLQRRLNPIVRRPISPETLAAVRREIDAFRAEYPEQMVVPPSEDPNAQVDLSGIDFAGMEARLITRGILPEVSMGARVLDPHEAAHHFEDLFQAPAPPDESNPVSRRIREALRAVVGEQLDDQRIQRLTHLSSQGMSRRAILEMFGLTETSSPEEVEEALGRQNQGTSPDPVRGRPLLGAIFDDAQPSLQGDYHVSSQGPARSRQYSDVWSHFNAIYGGDPTAQTSGIEPPPRRNSPRRSRARKEPPPPEDRTDIPTRYRRKPVI